MKKSIISLLFLVMILATLFGCGGNNNSGVISSSSSLSIIDVPVSIIDVPVTSANISIEATDLDVSSNKDKIAEAILDLVVYRNWNSETKNELLEEFDRIVTIDGENKTLITAIINVLEQSGITQYELDNLYNIMEDFGALIAEISEEVNEEYFTLTKGYLEGKITKIIELVNRFENTISEKKLGVFVITLIETASEAELINISSSINLPNKNDAIALVEFIFDMIDSIKKQGASRIAGLIMFIQDMLLADSAQDFFDGNGVYSYREMIGYINDFGMILIDLSIAMTPHSKTVENIVRKIIGNLFTGVFTIEEFLSVYGKNALVMVKLVGIILRDLTENNLSKFYLDIDAIAKYYDYGSEDFDKISTTPFARGVKILISAYDKLSSNEQVSLKAWINSILNIIVKNYDADIYDVTPLLTINAEDIINELRRISSYNADNLTHAQVEDIKSILINYIEKFDISYKSGYRDIHIGLNHIYEGYTSESIKTACNAYLLSIYSSISVTSVEVLNTLVGAVKVKVYYSNYGSNYWSINYLNVVSNPATSSVQIALDVAIHNKSATWYVFTPETSGTYMISSFNNIGDPYVELYDSSLSRIGSSDDDGDGVNFSLKYYLIAGETYYFLAKNWSYGTVVDYQIKLEHYQIPAVQILPNVTIQNNAETLYRFIPETSGEYIIYSFNSSGDPFIELCDASLKRLDYSDDYNGLNFGLVYYFIAGETYYFLAKSLSSTTSYQMRLEPVVY